jgi:hypothetical protein
MQDTVEIICCSQEVPLLTVCSLFYSTFNRNSCQGQKAPLCSSGFCLCLGTGWPSSVIGALGTTTEDQAHPREGMS